MSERTVKLCTINEAVQHVSNGSRVALGGFAVYQKPMALVHELIRAGKQNLTLVGAVHSLDADMLIGAGSVKRIETSYVGLEKYGLAQNYRRAVQEGKIKVVHYPEMLAWDRFRADREGLPFWPVYFLGGSDIVRLNPDIVPFTCPMTGRQAWAVPAAQPDVAILHAYAADKYGNVQIQDRFMLPQYMDVDIARSCKKIIVTVEHIIDTKSLSLAPARTVIPAFRTTCIVHVPGGSHPTPTLSVTNMDDRHLETYVEASRTPEAFRNYLDTHVLGVQDFQEYLRKAEATTFLKQIHGERTQE